VIRLAATQTTPAASPAASTPEPTEVPGAAEPSGAAEPAGTTEAPEAPGTPDVGHADNPNDPNADHQFDGNE
jgi:hypothetical protein